MKTEIDRPDKDFVTEDEAREWLKVRGVDLTGHLLEEWINSGWVRGVRVPVRGLRMIHWRGVVMIFWAFEMGELPVDPKEIPGRERPRTTAKGE